MRLLLLLPLFALGGCVTTADGHKRIDCRYAYDLTVAAETARDLAVTPAGVIAANLTLHHIEADCGHLLVEDPD